MEGRNAVTAGRSDRARTDTPAARTEASPVGAGTTPANPWPAAAVIRARPRPAAHAATPKSASGATSTTPSDHTSAETASLRSMVGLTDDDAGDARGHRVCLWPGGTDDCSSQAVQLPGTSRALRPRRSGHA